MNKKTMTDFFYTIDNISNTNEENNEIMRKTETEIDNTLKYYIANMQKMELRAFIKEYRTILDDLCGLVEEQKRIIESIIEEPDRYDFFDIFIKLREELEDYFIKMQAMEFSFLSQYLSKEECNVYNSVKTYRILDNYTEGIKRYNYGRTKMYDEIEDEEESACINWKTYFFSSICMDKHREANRAILSDYISRRKIREVADVYESKTKLSAINFQAQLSKSIFCQRKRLNITQVELSRLSGVDRSMIAKIEKINQPPTLETAIKLLSALNMDVAIIPLEEKEGMLPPA